MKKILISGAGGAAAIGFSRSLKLAPEAFYQIGVDSNKYHLQRAETDEKYLIPEAGEKDYLKILKKIIFKTRADFLYSPVDVEIPVISQNRDKLKLKTFLPQDRTIEICQNKFLSYQKWQKTKIKVPRTFLIKNQSDLKEAFGVLKKPIWIREIRGAFGKGSFLTSNLSQAISWIDFRKGWGKFSAAENLTSQSVTWQSIWHQGKLVVAQSRQRIYWEFSNRTPTGVTGLTGTGVTVSDSQVDKIAQNSILAIDQKPHGIFSLDLTYGQNTIPNPTEINIGRFFTTHLFFSQAGLNMPYIYLKLGLEDKIPKLKRKINPLPEGLAWIRGMDMEPILTDLKTIDSYEKELEKLRRKRK